MVVKYRYWTRPLYRKGRWATQEVTFKVVNSIGGLLEAKRYAKEIWPRRKWQIVAWQLRNEAAE